MRTPVRTGLLLAVALFAVFFAGLAGCRDVPVDRLYALYLDHSPGEDDWSNALPRLVTVRGGYKNVPPKFTDIDNDTVHTSTASCHHGASLPDPVQVDMRAFYTESDVFIRLSWSDPTRDDAMRRWTFNGNTWEPATTAEDGFGIMWDAHGSFPRFNCSYACHIDDFGVSGASFHARNRMRLARADALVDLWNWKADRTARAGFADDRYLTEKGMAGDVPGELFHPNSVRIGDGAPPYGQDDSPLLDVEGRPVASELHLGGEVAPGYLVDAPVGGRADVVASSRYRDGMWTVTLKRSLDTRDAHDVVFLPADEEGVAFGLSIMDNTLDQHYASTTEERLVLLARQIPD